MEPNNIDLLEAYVNGSLTPEEQMHVENRLRTDPAFKQDYEMYQLMISAIAENRKTELKTFISKNVRIKPIPFFRTPTFYAAAAASVVLCILSYFVIYKKLSEQNGIAQSEDTKSKTESTLPPSPDSMKPVANNPQANGKASEPVVVAGNTTPKTETKNGGIVPDYSHEIQKDSRENASESNISDLSSKPDDIKVEGDKMVLDSFLFISRKIYIAKPKQYQSSPDDLYTVITTGDPLKIEVQFWQSPINYAGYRFHKNLLMIYGNYDPALASFQELKDVVYMKYKNEYYKIVSGETYSSMKKETDPKVITDLEIKDKK